MIRTGLAPFLAIALALVVFAAGIIAFGVLLELLDLPFPPSQ